MEQKAHGAERHEMTTQQTDIEKTLKRILARELPAWPSGAKFAFQDYDGEVCFIMECGGYSGLHFFASTVAHDNVRAIFHPNPDYGVTRAEWEAERALLASEQAQPLGDSEEFDQALWDKVAIAAFAIHLPKCYSVREEISEAQNLAWDYASSDADAFMAERAKRIAARKASHD